MNQPSSQAATTSFGARVAFWVIAVLGVALLGAAWGWLGLTQLESATEECKEAATGNTMAGFTILIGGIPLLFCHIGVFAALFFTGRPAYRSRGTVLAVVILVVVSLIAVAIWQAVAPGFIFTGGTTSPNCMSY